MTLRVAKGTVSMATFAGMWLQMGLLCWLTCLARTEPELTYSIIEEEARGSFVGDVVADARLDTFYDEDAFRQIYFSFLHQNQDIFVIEESTGILRTAQRIDRDTMCPGEAECQVRIDVAVKPVQYFKIVKVFVNIEDINDNAPWFSEENVVHEILESALPGISFALPSAEDGDSPKYGVKQFELVSGENAFNLVVGEGFDGGQDLRLQLMKKLDREERSSYEMQVIVYDGGSPARSGTIDIEVSVLDTNDNNPVFDRSDYEVRIQENTMPGTSILQVHAEDRDIGLNGQVVYAFSPRTKQSHGSKFRMNNMTGELIVTGVIDFEEMEVYHLAVMAWDRGADSMPGTTNVIVRVDDTNDHAPDISVSTLSGSDIADIYEGFQAGTFVAQVMVIDLDTGNDGAFNCTLSDPFFNLVQLEEIGQYQIRTAVVLDRERQPRYSLTVQCTDHGESPQVALRHIKVNVLDVNDNAPVFPRDVFRASIIENSYVGAMVVTVNATDSDLGENATVTYALNGTDAENFTIGEESGIIRANKPLDREAHAELEFYVVATDGGEHAMSSSTLVKVSVQDVNDERPNFAPIDYSFSVLEHAEVGSKVGDVTAVDKDSPPYNEFTYSIMPSHTMAMGVFAIDRYTGRITVQRDLDREVQSYYHLVISASDRGVPPLSSTVGVAIYVADKNDHAPVFDFPKSANNTVYLSNRVSKGYLITQIHAHDKDHKDNSRIRFFLIRGDPEGLFELDTTIGTILVNRQLSHIQNELFELTIEARDQGDFPLSTMAKLNILVNNTIPLWPNGQSGGGAGGGGASGGGLSEQNMLIVIILASVSGVITIILVVAIIVIRRQDRFKPTARYNCRMEAMKVVATSKQQQLDQQTTEICMGNGKVSTLNRGGKEVSFNMMEEGCDEISARSWPSSFDTHALQHPQACSSIVTRHGMSPTGGPPAYQPRGHRPPPQGASQRGRPLSPREMEVHQLLQLLKRDSDTLSAHSAEDSATDSGRGHSEEGEANIRPPTNGGSAPSTNGSNTPVQPYPQHQSLMTRDVSCGSHSHSLSNQVVPNTTGCSSPSYSCHTPHVMHTFTSPPSTKQRGINRSGDSTCHTTMMDDSMPFDDGFIHTTPAKVLALDPDTCYQKHKPCHDNRMKDFHGSLHSYHSNGEDEDDLPDDYETTEMTDGGMLYSCADMTEDVLAKSITMTAGSIDDDATSTSGSYLVDPQDLCEEIDELFFKDMGL